MAASRRVRQQHGKAREMYTLLPKCINATTLNTAARPRQRGKRWAARIVRALLPFG